MIYRKLFILTAFYDSKPRQQILTRILSLNTFLQAPHVNPKDINSNTTTLASFDSNLKRAFQQ